ncbi:MAG: AAA family ATPase [Synergistaceae bacterium]|nr:AAA family ATPase [Synergistaceae bacterium]
MFGKFIEKYYPDGTLYFEGLSRNGIPDGYGKLYYKNGSLQYEGTFAEGKYHGNGTLYDEDGREIYTGEWFNGHQLKTDTPKDYKPEGKSKELQEYLDEMNSLIGLMNVKKELHGLINFVRLQSLREKKGLKLPVISLHMVFTGNPGTGKTTVARLFSKILHELGYLSKGHVIETNRAGMVAGYLGQTALKTEEKIKQSIGGVLFIDEAYSLANDDEYGQEAIDTLLKLMEDYRDDLVVIVAGYPALMKKFIDSNPGLASRFSRYVEFTDYSSEELIQIFDYICTKYSYTIDSDGRIVLTEHVNKLLASKDERFGNARTIRNIFEHVITFHANRIMSMDRVPDELSVITKADIIRCIHEKEI